MFAAVHILAVNYLDQLNTLANQAVTTGKAAGAAVAVIFIIVAYALRRTLGAVFAAVIVAGVALYAINHTSDLEKNTADTFGAAPAATAQGMPAPGWTSGGSGGGGGSTF